MTEFLRDLLQNPLFVSPACAWFAAQFIKTILYVVINKEFNAERIFGSGGMPSSHSATVCAIAVASGFRYGATGFEFPMAAFFAFIVMYDAMGVRRETGEQAKILNELIEQWFEMGRHFTTRNPMDQFKELVGHTPLQVLMGAILGILVSGICCSIML